MATPPLNEQQLQALLRLKRHEQPPPGYFDDLLHKVHRRQREEMLRRPAWRLMTDRIGAFFASFHKDLVYAGSMAAVLLAGVVAIRVAVPMKSPVNATASTQISTEHLAQASAVVTTPVPSGSNTAALQFQLSAPTHSGNSNRREVKVLRSGPPRFVIDAQPASYEQTQIEF